LCLTRFLDAFFLSDYLLDGDGAFSKAFDSDARTGARPSKHLPINVSYDHHATAQLRIVAIDELATYDDSVTATTWCDPPNH
jgi:hypothetical protein